LIIAQFLGHANMEKINNILFKNISLTPLPPDVKKVLKTDGKFLVRLNPFS
jgi:hypothetical protein